MGTQKPADAASREDAITEAVFAYTRVGHRIEEESTALARSKAARDEALERLAALVNQARKSVQVGGLVEAAAAVAFHEEDRAVHEARLAVLSELHRTTKAVVDALSRPETST